MWSEFPDERRYLFLGIIGFMTHLRYSLKLLPSSETHVTADNHIDPRVHFSTTKVVWHDVSPANQIDMIGAPTLKSESHLNAVISL